MNHIKVLKKKKTERERGRGGRERRGRNRKRGEQTCLENKNIAHFSWFSTILKERKTESEPIPLVIRNAADLHTACPQPLRAPTAYLPCFTCTAHALQVVLTEQNKELRNETHKTCPRGAFSFTVGVTVRLASGGFALELGNVTVRLSKHAHWLEVFIDCHCGCVLIDEVNF